MSSWVFTWRVEPPANKVISVRFGSSVMFAAYSPVVRQWYHVYPGGEERIEEPPMWFCEEEWAANHQRENIVRPETISSCRKRKGDQLLLF